MRKPNFEVTSSFLLQLMKFSANNLHSEADVLNAFDALNKSTQSILTDQDVKPLEDGFESRVPENLKSLVSAIHSVLEEDK